MPTISIIMPVFNAEKTVSRMIDSIRAQTFKDWELIAINDGSKDQSGNILEYYSKIDKRIKIIHKVNAGVAAARQDGIQCASGTFTIHADADDWMEPDMLEDMTLLAITEKADIVIADFYIDKVGRPSLYSNQQPLSLIPKDVLYGFYAKGLFGGLWHKLIKKTVYDKTQIKFQTGINYCEDLLFLTQLLTKTKPTIRYINKAYYHYVVNSESLTQHVSAEGLESIKRFHSKALHYLNRDNRFQFLNEKFLLDEFKILFINKLYPNKNELISEFNKISKIAYNSTKSLRWLLGYFCIQLRLIKFAHKLIKY